MLGRQFLTNGILVVFCDTRSDRTIHLVRDAAKWWSAFPWFKIRNCPYAVAIVPGNSVTALKYRFKTAFKSCSCLFITKAFVTAWSNLNVNVIFIYLVLQVGSKWLDTDIWLLSMQNTYYIVCLLCLTYSDKKFYPDPLCLMALPCG